MSTTYNTTQHNTKFDVNHLQHNTTQHNTKKKKDNVRSEAITVVQMKIQVFWDVMPC
jgi:hypothetical protein